MSSVEGTQISATSEENKNKKQGHVYCGLCCDMRRAVVIVNILSVIDVIIKMVTIAGVNRIVLDQNPDQFELLAKLEQAMSGVFVMSIASILFSFFAAYGAINYKVIPVVIQAVFVVIYFISVNFIMQRASQNHDYFQYGFFNWAISLVVTLLFIYPHAMLITELRSGIMSAETYAREKRSCCCV